MTREQAENLEKGDSVIYDPGYKRESGYVTSKGQYENGDPIIFVCYDGTGRGQNTPYKDLN